MSAAALEGLLGVLRAAKPLPEQPRLSDLPWDQQLAAIRAASAPIPAHPPTSTATPMVYTLASALVWLDRATTALEREPTAREILSTVLGGTPTKAEVRRFTASLHEAGAVASRSTKGRRELVWRRAA